ncbi:MAG: STAS domain-containing protein [Geobacter sp.]|nr:STAS domain-containing protein [Geobacter sp.]
MTTESGDIVKICLDGDWSMNGVRDKFPVLAKILDSFSGADNSDEQQKNSSEVSPEIDLSGVTDFDACGCQLLALFIRKLNQGGFTARLINLSDTFKSKIHSLGFDRELNLIR